MKTIKPNAVGLLTRTFEFRGRCYFVVSPLLFVTLTGGLRLRTEGALWQFVAAELGGQPIDAGMPKTTPEYLVHGAACPPGGMPAPACPVRARFAGGEKILYVFGDREWQGAVASAPQPFAELPLDWSHAFGGPEVAANPAGRGAARITAGGASYWPLPNVEYPDDRLTKPGQAIRPAGFGPRDVTHPDRRALAGSYDEKWLQTDFPGLPRDADWKHFNVATPDQWLGGPIAGDEEWEFENLHPSERLLRGRLPGLATRCFIHRGSGPDERFEELATRFDTVWFFPHRECAILVGRGMVEVADEDAEEIRTLVVAAEWGGEARPMAHYVDAVKRRLDPERGHFLLLKEDDLLPSGIGDRLVVEQPVELPAEAPTLLSENLSRRQRAEIEQARAVVASHGLDPDAGHAPALPEPFLEGPKRLEDLPAHLDRLRQKADEIKAAGEKRSAELDAARRALFASLGMDYSVIEQESTARPKGPPDFNVRAEFDRLAALRREVGPGEDAIAKELDHYLHDPGYRARLEDAERQMKEAYRATAHLQDAADPMATDRAAWVKERAAAHHRAGQRFAGANLTGADLSGLDLSGADFTATQLEGANLEGCRLSGCILDRAVLARARLAGADLSGASLRHANLGGARCVGANFAGAVLAGAILGGADLTDARFAGADLEQASLAGGARFGNTDWSNVRAAGLVVVDADLKGLRCCGADLERSTFVRCDIGGVDFSAARLARAIFVQAKAAGARFRGAVFSGSTFVGGSDLRQADFSGAEISTSYFSPADLSGARFDGATMKEADFSRCRLAGASFAMAIAVDCRFVKADLAGASFASADLRNSSLARAKLEGADFRGANLYAADLARVAVDTATNFTGALTRRARTYPRLAKPAGGAAA